MIRRAFEVLAGVQHLVHVRWNPQVDGQVPQYFGPFDNVADATEFEALFKSEHGAQVQEMSLEQVIGVAAMMVSD